MPGYAIEPTVGLKLQRGPASRRWVYAKLVVGGLFAAPDRWSGGAGALLRAGVGFRHALNSRLALIVEATGAAGVGGFTLGYQSSQNAVAGFDVGLGLAWGS